MTRFGVVVIHPQSDSPNLLNFQTREFADWPEFAEFMTELETLLPQWRIVSVCHVEDLPLMLEGAQRQDG